MSIHSSPCLNLTPQQSHSRAFGGLLEWSSIAIEYLIEKATAISVVLSHEPPPPQGKEMKYAFGTP